MEKRFGQLGFGRSFNSHLHEKEARRKFKLQLAVPSVLRLMPPADQTVDARHVNMICMVPDRA
jgi:hypothetical protein